MTVSYTTYLDLVAVKNELPSAQDWAVTYWNWFAIDRIIYNLFTHSHDGGAALGNPAGDLSLSTATTGGTIPAGRTYYAVATYIDSYGRETAKGVVGNITTDAGLSAPSTPTYNSAVDLVAEASTLTGGDYWYKISYLKGGGETTCSEPVYVSVPTDTTYKVTIHFDALDDVANGADTIRVYRKIDDGSYVKLSDITAGSRDYYTDDNTGVPVCDIGPVATNTTNSFNTITIDWSGLDVENASSIRVYISSTTDSSATPVATWLTSSMLVGEFDLDVATPPTSTIWTGTLTTGRPPNVTETLSHPSKINLTGAAEIQGNIPWANLPSDFVWQEPVDSVGDLPSGETVGEIRLVKDENTLYLWEDAATPYWVEISGGGIQVVEVEYLDDIETQLSDVEVENGEIVAVVPTSTNTNYRGNYGLFIYRENYATPFWQRINPVLPTVNDGDILENNAEAGTMWLRKGTYIDDYYLVVKHSEDTSNVSYVPMGYDSLRSYLGIHSGYYYDKQEIIDDGWDFSGGANEWNTYDGILIYTVYSRVCFRFDETDEEWVKVPTFQFRGVFSDTTALDALVDIDNNDVAYVLSDDSATPVPNWFIYDGDAATPAWTPQNLKSTGDYVADITTDMSADANDDELKDKVNEILAALRTAGVIE